MNCIHNNGDQRLSDNKFTWSQGRWLWVLARVYRLAKQGVLPKVDPAELEPLMDETFRFLADKSIYGPEDICCYLLTRDGEKLVDEPTGRYDASIYADCFALIGSAQYAKMTQNTEAADVAHRLYRSITKRVERGDFLTEPYPVPDGYQVHGIPMILVDTVQEYMDMRRSFGLDVAEQESYVRGKVHFILDVLYDGDGLIREHLSDDKSYTCWTGTSTPATRWRTPGSCWNSWRSTANWTNTCPVLRRSQSAPSTWDGTRNTAACFGLWIGRAARPGVTASAHRMRSW